MIYLNDKDLVSILKVKDLLPEMVDIFKKQAAGKVNVLDRQRLVASNGVLDMMAAVDEEDRLAVTKTYFFGKGSDFVITLYNTDTSEVLLTVRGKKLTQVRTAAVSGVATSYLSREDASILGIIGTGFQAEEQIKGIMAVREIKTIYVYDKNLNKAKDFIEKLHIAKNMILKGRVDKDFKNADIILTATQSDTPVISDSFINDSAYINCMGSYKTDMSEIETRTVCDSKIIVVDSLKQSIRESGEIYNALQQCVLIDEINELKDIVSGKVRDRKSSGNKVLFKTVGSAIEDLAASKFVYLKAKEMNLGKKLD